MVSAFTPNKRIEQPAHNDYVDSWDVPVNADLAIIDLALGSGVNLNLTGLSGNQGLAAAQYQPLKLIVSGSPAAAVNLVIPANVGGLWVVRNNTTGGFAITISSAAGGAAVTIPANTNTLVTCDGSASGMFYAINTPPPAAGTNSQVQYNNNGLLAGAGGATWDGTTLATTGLNNTGSTVLGDAAGDTLGINGTALTAPNGLNFNSNQLRLGATPYNQVMINAVAPYGSSALTVGGVITSTAGGYYFPDGTNQTSATTIPAGCIMAYAGPNVPSGWFHCFGQTLSRATWPALFAALGGAASPYGLPDANTFNLPDLRGRVIAEVDGGSGRLTTSYFGVNAEVVGAASGYEYARYLTGMSGLGVSAAPAGYGGNWWAQGGGVAGWITSGQIKTGNADSFVEGLAFGGNGTAAQSHVHIAPMSRHGDVNGYNSLFMGEGYMTGIVYYQQDGTSQKVWSDYAYNTQPTMVMYWIIKA